MASFVDVGMKLSRLRTKGHPVNGVMRFLLKSISKTLEIFQ